MRAVVAVGSLQIKLKIWKLVLTGTWFAGAVMLKTVLKQFYRDSKSLREACSFGLLLEIHREKWFHCSVC